jgi:hypothetical protein
MTYRGHIKNGVVVLDQPQELPEGAEVKVELAEPAPHPSLWDKLREVAGTVEGLPSDFGRNHDHYLYGTPKRDEAAGDE